MTYEELGAHGARIKQLAIEKTAELAQKIAGPEGGGMAYSIAHDEAKKTYADVHTIFDDWKDLPDPGRIENEVNNINRALPYLATEGYIDNKFPGVAGTSNNNMTQVGETAAFMQGWQMGTATSYANFAGLFVPVVSNQWICANVLRGAVTAEVELWRKARESVDSIAHAAINTLEHILDKSPEGFVATLKVIAAISGIVAVPFTAGGSLAAGFTFSAIAGATGVGELFAPKAQPVDKRIDGGSPTTVINSVNTYLRDLNQQICDAEDDIAKAMNDTTTNIRSAMAAQNGASPFIAPRPTVADNPSLGGHS